MPAMAPVMVLTVLLATAASSAASAANTHSWPQQPPARLKPKTSSVAPASSGGGIHPMVVGGLQAPVGRMKHQVGFNMQKARTPGCGASLLREDVVLTARHCGAAKGHELIVGAFSSPFYYFEASEGSQKVTVARVLSHPDPDVDMTLMFLEKCVQLTDAVQPIKLATKAELAAAQSSTWLVSGWGSTSENSDSWGQDGNMPHYLQYANVKPTDCAQDYWDYYPDKEVCAGRVPSMNGDTTPPYTDTCQGDSGGPMTFNVGSPSSPLSGSASDDRLVGVTSWGYGCGVKLGVYASVPYVNDWITSQMDSTLKPCSSPNTTLSFVKTSDAANWYPKPSRTINGGKKRGNATEALAWCKSECYSSRMKRSTKSCVAFSVSYGKGSYATVPRCDMWYAVPLRTCQAGDKLSSCQRPSGGSYRIAYVDG